MTHGFSPQISSLLDEFVVPDLPDGFTDRVVAAATGQKLVEQSSSASRPWARFRSNKNGSPWKRSRFYVSGIAGMAMLSTAAAAALSLADIPYRIPVVSDIVEQVIPRSEPVQIVEAPEPAPARPSAGDDANPADEALTEQSAKPRWRDLDRQEKIAVVKQRIAQNEERVQQRRAARGLPPLSKTQLRERRIMIRRAIRSGAISRPAVRRALRRTAFVREGRPFEPQRTATPAIADTVSPAALDMQSAVPANASIAPSNPQDVWVADAQSTLTDSEGTENPVPTPVPTVSEATSLVEEVESSGASGTETDQATDIDSADVTTIDPAVIDLKDKLPPALKERLRKASPAERRRILRELRLRRQNGKSMREIRQRLRDMRRTGK